MLTSPVDYLIVKLDKAFQDTITTESGFSLHKGQSLTPEWDVTTVGTVVSVPNRLSKRHELEGLTIEVETGDKIIMSYMVVFAGSLRDRDTFYHENLFYYEGEYYWKCDYYFYLGKVKEGKIIPAQGYVFCEPITEEKEEKVGLIYMPEMNKVEKPKGKGRVIGIGTPKKSEQPLSIKEGDIVRYAERYACKYEVEGKQIIVLDNSMVLATETV